MSGGCIRSRACFAGKRAALERHQSVLGENERPAICRAEFGILLPLEGYSGTIAGLLVPIHLPASRWTRRSEERSHLHRVAHRGPGGPVLLACLFSALPFLRHSAVPPARLQRPISRFETLHSEVRLGDTGYGVFGVVWLRTHGASGARSRASGGGKNGA